MSHNHFMFTKPSGLFPNYVYSYDYPLGTTVKTTPLLPT